RWRRSVYPHVGRDEGAARISPGSAFPRWAFTSLACGSSSQSHHRFRWDEVSSRPGRRAGRGGSLAKKHGQSERSERQRANPRPIWSGYVSFGLVNIPIQLHRADRPNDLRFELVDSRDRARIRYQRVNEATGKEVPWKDVVKAYEYQEGDYVLLKDADFRRVAVQATKIIQIEDFVPKDEIDIAYYDRPYYLTPNKA